MFSRRSHRELVAIGFADDDGASLLQSGNYGGIIWWPIAIKNARPRRRQLSTRADHILYRDWYAEERSVRSIVSALVNRSRVV
jgi:hypothetical protein